MSPHGQPMSVACIQPQIQMTSFSLKCNKIAITAGENFNSFMNINGQYRYIGAAPRGKGAMLVSSEVSHVRQL